MVIRLGRPVEDWMYCEASSEVTFPNENLRNVRMDIRTEVRTSIYADFGHGDVFLCNIDGIETVEFTASGAFSLSGDGPMYVRSNDSIYVNAENVDDDIFTKMHERRPMAPEFVEMQKLMHRNSERMRAQMMRDVDGMMRSTRRELERREKALLEAEAAAAAAGSDAGDQSESPAKASGSKAESGSSAESTTPKK